MKQWVAGERIQGDRGYQEDDFSIRLLSGDDDREDEDRLLLVLADGMGGHAGGAVASATVVQGFQAGFDRDAPAIADRFNAGIDTANRMVREKQQADSNLSEMGATLVAALVVGSKLYWTSVGDSILWLFRDGSLRRLNADHSMRPLLLDLVELGRMTRDEALADPRINQLRSAIFGEDVPMIDMNADGFGLESGDLVLLASDGLETLPENAMTDVIRAAAGHAGAIVDALLDAVAKAEKPGQDNTTALAYRVGQGDDSLHGALAGAHESDPAAGAEQQVEPSRANAVRAGQPGTPPGAGRQPGLLARLLRAVTGNRAAEK